MIDNDWSSQYVETGKGVGESSPKIGIRPSTKSVFSLGKARMMDRQTASYSHLKS